MISAASLTSNSPRSRGPVMLSRMPVAPSTEDSSSGELIACLAASIARFSPLSSPMPISAVPASCMIARTSAKSRLIRPGIVIRSVIPWTPWRRTLSASRKASRIEVRRSTIASSFSLGITISVSTCSRRRWTPSAACLERCDALELERARDDADGQRADLLLGDLGDDRRGAGAGAAALAGGDEDHVRALERLLDLVA